jgi:hypothetical protein
MSTKFIIIIIIIDVLPGFLIDSIESLKWK